LAGLEHLNLYGNPIGPVGLAALLEAPFAGRLTRLVLSSCELDDAALAALFGSARFPNLAELNIWGNVPGEAAFRALGGDGACARGGWVALGGCRLPPPWAELLGLVGTLPGLRRLRLSRCPLGPEGARRLLAGPLARGVEWLDLEHCELGDEGAAALAA